MKSLSSICLTICLVGLVVCGCSDDKSTNSDPNKRQPLAGGGRYADGDEYTGWNDTSGPGFPEPWPGSGLATIFYSNVSCFGAPQQRVIRDSTEWVRWLDSAQACLSFPGPDSLHHLYDSGVVDTVIPGDSGGGIFTNINFDSSVVIVIGLEADSGRPRILWINDVSSPAGGAVVSYTVARFGDDCGGHIYTGPDTLSQSSPIVAVIAPRPVDDPVSFTRKDTVWNCSWEPDPNTPVSIYYTDTPCDLGPNEQLITDSATWLAWVTNARICDSTRWWERLADSGYPTTITIGYTMPVDFTTHAVIVLRAGPQTRWGGGVWLDKVSTNNGSTVADYTVMQPGTDCPVVEGISEANPTVAIRVPRPIGPDVTWNRHTETINCDWGDSTGMGGGGGM